MITFSRKRSLREETRNSLHKSDGETKVIFSLRKKKNRMPKVNIELFNILILNFAYVHSNSANLFIQTK